uniref:Uncharacterized protein n=1 Tax=Romanomermis culicivorax TaxID=13658 RepID=A0A915K012_ROMCU
MSLCSTVHALSSCALMSLCSTVHALSSCALLRLCVVSCALLSHIKFSPDSSYLCASSDKGTIHIFCVEDLSLNKRSALQNIPVLGGSYVDSQWALAKCPGIAESPCICGFSNNQSVVAIYEEGSFCKYVFTKNGTCRREAFERFLSVTDDQDFWNSYKLY